MIVFSILTRVWGHVFVPKSMLLFRCVVGFNKVLMEANMYSSQNSPTIINVIGIYCIWPLKN